MIEPISARNIKKASEENGENNIYLSKHVSLPF
jgi:hypothetical protein